MAIDFSPQDVWRVARAIGEGVYVDETQSKNSYERCLHCEAFRYHDWKHGYAVGPGFQHESHCPVLIARDLLTGAPE